MGQGQPLKSALTNLAGNPHASGNVALETVLLANLPSEKLRASAGIPNLGGEVGWAVPPCVRMYKDVLLDLATVAVLLHIGEQQLHTGQAFATFPKH